MKRIKALLLAIGLLLCLAGCGCDEHLAGTSAPAGSSGTNPTTTDPQQTPPPTDHRDPSGGGQVDPNQLQLGQTGQLRVTYTINMSSVRYITSADQLPDYEELKVFDEAYFQEKALIIVFETVNSGMIRVDIESVSIDGDIASVRLAHANSGGVSTGDMTTWLVWAEVDKDLAYSWVVENPSVKSDASEY